MDKIVLKVEGKAFEGWTDVSIRRSLANACGSFNLSVSNRYLEPSSWETTIGSVCSIEINNQTVLIGYIDDINISYSGSDHSIEFTGRDKTCDLVDCYLEPRQYLGQSIKDLIKKICTFYGITVSTDTGIDSIVSKKANNAVAVFDLGKTAYEKITELCRQVGVMATCYGDGRLVLTRSGLNGRTTDSIKNIFNVAACSTQYSNRERYGQYNIYGQANRDETTSIDSSVVKNTVATPDTVIKRTRVFNKHIDIADVNTCNNYAKFEKNYRAGMSRKINYTVIEWTQSDGSIWEINQKVFVNDTHLGIKKDQLINDLEFSYSQSNGTLTKIGVVDTNTYTLTALKTAETDFDSTKLESTL